MIVYLNNTHTHISFECIGRAGSRNKERHTNLMFDILKPEKRIDFFVGKEFQGVFCPYRKRMEFFQCE